MINEITEINQNTDDGRLAMVLLAHITTTTHTNKTPDETIKELNEKYFDAMYMKGQY